MTRAVVLTGAFVFAVWACDSKAQNQVVEPRAEPDVQIASIPIRADEVDDMAVGSDHLCVLVEGDVYCVGDQTSPTKKRLAAATEWTEIELPGSAVAISSSNLRACAVTESGKLACWGGYNHLPARIEVVEDVADVEVYGDWRMVNRFGGIVSWDDEFAIKRDGSVVRIIGESGEPVRLEGIDEIVKWQSVDSLCDDCEDSGYWVTLDRSGAVEWGEIRADGERRHSKLGVLTQGASDVAIAHYRQPREFGIHVVREGELMIFDPRKRRIEHDLDVKVSRVEGRCALDVDRVLHCVREVDGDSVVFDRPFGEREVRRFEAEKDRFCAWIDQIECMRVASVESKDNGEFEFVRLADSFPLPRRKSGSSVP